MKKFVISSVAVASFAFAFVASAATAADMGSVTLRQGSRGASVIALQSNLNTCAGQSLATDGVFGKGTAAAVRAFQSSQSLKADALVGNATKSALTALCAGTTGTTGNTSNLPAGCTSTAGYSPVNGAKCDSGSTSNGALTGTVGMIKAVNNISSGLSSKAAENTERKVLAFDIEADKGSDLSIDALSLEISNTNSTSTTRLTKLINDVIIYQDSTEVASVRSSDFNRNISDNTNTVNISLSKKVVIKSGQKARFYVAVEGNSVIDSKDLNDSWTIKLTQVARYTDASGAIMSYGTPGVSRPFSFESSANSDGVKLQSSPNNPSATNFKVDEDKVSDENLVLAFRLKGDTNSGNMNILNIPIAVSATTPTQLVIDDIYLKVGNKVFDNASTTDTNTNNGIYNFKIDEGDLVIGGSDNTEVKVFVKFNSFDGNYPTGTSVKFSVSGTSITAENNNGDAIPLDGSSAINGETHSLLGEGLNVAYVSDSSTRVDNDGKVRDFVLVFDVTAEGNDVIINRTTTGTSGIDFVVNGASVSTTSFALNSNASLSGGNYTVYEGQTKRFTLTVTVTASTSGPYSVELTEVTGVSVSNIETAAQTVVA